MIVSSQTGHCRTNQDLIRRKRNLEGGYCKLVKNGGYILDTGMLAVISKQDISSLTEEASATLMVRYLRVRSQNSGNYVTFEMTVFQL